MTKSIIHAIKKFLRIGVVAVTVTSGSVNASAGVTVGVYANDCSSQLSVILDGSGYALVDPVMLKLAGEQDVSFISLDKVVVEIAGSNPVHQEVTQEKHTVTTTLALLDCTMIGQNVGYNLVKYYLDGTINSCQGNILIEDKMPPSILGSDLKINCTDNTEPTELTNNYFNAVPTATDNCEISSFTFQDSEEDYNCLNPDFLKKIMRTWTAIDGSGNQTTYTQNIFIKKADGANIQFPTHLSDTIGAEWTEPATDLEAVNTGYPTLNGVNISDQNSHNFSSSYQDQTIKNSEAHFKIRRNWTVVDWCTNEIFSQPQIINIETSKNTD